MQLSTHPVRSRTRRNDYYGAESASLNLTQVRLAFSRCRSPLTMTRVCARLVLILHLGLRCLREQLYKKFRGTEPPAELGRDRDYAVDLIPKLCVSPALPPSLPRDAEIFFLCSMMANGEMTKMLVHTDVTRYLEFKQIAGSYVFRDGRISKVPSTEMEAVKSPLMGLFEKRRARNFFLWVQGYQEEDLSSHQGALSFPSSFPPVPPDWSDPRYSQALTSTRRR